MFDVDLVVTVNSNCQTYISLSTYEVLLMVLAPLKLIENEWNIVANIALYSPTCKANIEGIF